MTEEEKERIRLLTASDGEDSDDEADSGEAGAGPVHPPRASKTLAALEQAYALEESDIRSLSDIEQ